MGSFQEFPQVASSKHFAKYAARPASLSQIPFIIEKVFDIDTLNVHDFIIRSI